MAQDSARKDGLLGMAETGQSVSERWKLGFWDKQCVCINLREHLKA